jgi:hypothetical protein
MSADALPGLLRSLRLPTVAREYAGALQRAEAETEAINDFYTASSRPRATTGFNTRSSAR